jgi:hypothetical protein
VTGEGREIALPHDLAAGAYEVVVGLFTERGRLSLRGERAGRTRYRIGTVRVAADGRLSFEASRFEPPALQGNPPGTMVDFGPAITDGAFRAEVGEREVVITPLPEAGPMRIRLRVPEGWPADGAWKAVALARAGTVGEAVSVEMVDGLVGLTTQAEDFGYRVTVRGR